MDLLSYLLIPAVIVLGLFTSYNDLKSGLIKNKWILFSILYAFTVYTLLFFFFGNIVSKEYLSTYIINFMFAIFVAVLIWFCNLWPSGDAKLFIAYSLLIPLPFYGTNTMPYFPSFVLLVNTFIPFFIYYVGKIIFKTKTKTKLEVLNKLRNKKYLAETILFVFSFSWIMLLITPVLSPIIPITNNLFVNILLLFLTLYILNNLLKIPLLKISIVLSIAAVLFSFDLIFSFIFLARFASLLFLLLFVRHFLLHLAFEVFSYPVYLEKLKPGMVLAEYYIESSYNKIQITPLSFVSSLLERSESPLLFPRSSEGITKEEIRKVNELHSSGIIKDHTIRVFQTVPFAPFLFFGALLTLIIKSSIFVL